MQRFIKNFGQNKSGAVAIIVGLSIVMLVAILLLTIDLGRQQNSKFNTQGAADSSALVAAQYITQYLILHKNAEPPLNDYTSKAKAAFIGNANLDEDLTTFEPGSFSATLNKETINGKTKVISVTVHGCHITRDKYDLDNPASQKRVCSNATANVGRFENAEIVFALDVSASMRDLVQGKQKISMLQDAATNVITELRTDAGVTNVIPNVYWGVVPFRGMVDLGVYGQRFTEDDFPLSASNILGNEQAYETGTPGSGEPANVVNNGNMKYKLQRVALTQRIGESGNNIANNDDAPTGNDKFKAYWHHPLDYWFYWKGEASCGLCQKWPRTEDVWTTDTCFVDQCHGEMECKQKAEQTHCERNNNGDEVCHTTCDCLRTGPVKKCSCNNYEVPTNSCAGNNNNNNKPNNPDNDDDDNDATTPPPPPQSSPTPPPPSPPPAPVGLTGGAG